MLVRGNFLLGDFFWMVSGFGKNLRNKFTMERCMKKHFCWHGNLTHMKSLRFHLVMQELLFKLYVTREFELKHLSLLPPPPSISSPKKKAERERNHQNARPVQICPWRWQIPHITVVGGGVFIERPINIFVCSFLHDVNKKRTLRNLCGVGSRDWFVHNICIPVQCNCNSDGFHLVLSRCKMSLLLFWCDEIMMMSMKVQLRSQLSLSLTRCPSKREPWERDWWRVEDSSVTNFIEMCHHQ